MPGPFVWDAHAGFGPSIEDLGELEAWADAGVNHVSVNVGYDVMVWSDAVRVLGSYRTYLERASDRFLLAKRYDDVERAVRAGLVSVSFDLEGLGSLDSDVRLIEVYHALGVRQMGFAYNLNNAFAGGCHDDDAGLTPLGRVAVDEMNRLGVVVDGSHAGRRSSLEMMERSTQPVVFSHSNCAAIHEHGRNITDEQIEACAATDGVVGINGLSLFLGPGDPVEAFVRHVAHVAGLVGPRHVGLGTDAVIASEPFDEALERHARVWPREHGYGEAIDFLQPADIARITTRLEEGGWRGADLEGILGGNFRRVAARVWRSAEPAT